MGLGSMLSKLCSSPELLVGTRGFSRGFKAEPLQWLTTMSTKILPTHKGRPKMPWWGEAMVTRRFIGGLGHL